LKKIKILSNTNSYFEISPIIKEKISKIVLAAEQIKNLNCISYKF